MERADISGFFSTSMPSPARGLVYCSTDVCKSIRRLEMHLTKLVTSKPERRSTAYVARPRLDAFHINLFTKLSAGSVHRTADAVFR